MSAEVDSTTTKTQQKTVGHSSGPKVTGPKFISDALVLWGCSFVFFSTTFAFISSFGGLLLLLFPLNSCCSRFSLKVLLFSAIDICCNFLPFLCLLFLRHPFLLRLMCIDYLAKPMVKVLVILWLGFASASYFSCRCCVRKNLKLQGRMQRLARECVQESFVSFGSPSWWWQWWYCK